MIRPPKNCNIGAEEMWLAIPEHLREGIVRYIDEHITPGSFLTAIIQNNLRRAMASADPTSTVSLRTICSFFYNFAPPSCYGSPAKMAEWTGVRLRELST